MKVILLFMLFFIAASCSNDRVLPRKNISSIKVYKSSRKVVNKDTFPVYKEIVSEQGINMFVSVLNNGKKNRYIIINPHYYIEVLYPDTIIGLFIAENCFRLKTTYETPFDLSSLIEDLN